MLLHPESIPAEVLEWLPPDLALREPRQGQTAAVAFVTGSPLVIKRARGPVYATWLEQEYRALVALADADLPIPEAVGLHSMPASDGADCEAWLVMARLPGDPLTDVVARAQTTEARAEWYRQLGVLAARIHSAPIPAALKPDDPRRWLERVLERARKAPGRWVQKLVARFDRERSPDCPETLIHGDLTIDNVLADGETLTGIIDWGGAGPGDPRYDVTLALSPPDDRRLEPEIVVAFLEGYGSHGLPTELRAFFEHSYDLP
ncbi:MAG: phosphotransferase [Myxococcota bacterium]